MVWEGKGRKRLKGQKSEDGGMKVKPLVSECPKPQGFNSENTEKKHIRVSSTVIAS